MYNDTFWGFYVYNKVRENDETSIHKMLDCKDMQFKRKNPTECDCLHILLEYLRILSMRFFHNSMQSFSNLQ